MSAKSTVRITDADKEILTSLCERYNMKQPVVIGYLLEQAIRCDMMESDWIDQLTKASFHDLLIDADLDYRKGFEIAKYKATLNVKQMMIKEMIKAMPIDERADYLKRTLGDPAKDVDLLDNMTNHQMYTINGEKRMYSPGQDGRPALVGIPPSQILNCPRGWHIKHNPCVGCNISKTCEFIFNEKVEWLALHGTTEEREEYIKRSKVRRLGN